MKEELLQAIFALLNDAYTYAVLRNYERLPDACDSRDIDILIPWRELKRLKPELLRIAAETGCGVLYENYDHQFWTVVYADDDAQVFQLDFQFNFAWMGIDVLDEEEVLRHRLFNGRVWHLDAMYEFLPKYLYCRILGGKYPEKYASIKQSALPAGETEVVAVLKRLSLGKGGLEYWDKASKWGLRLRSFTAAILRNPFRAWWRMLCFVMIYIWQLFTRRGMMVSFSGPDGCGKTTVIDLVMERLAVNPPYLYHFRPSLLPNLGKTIHHAGLKKSVDENFDQPHRATRKGNVNSLLRLGYYFSDYLIGYMFKILPIRQRKHIIFFDRYFTDMIVDSERSSIFLNYKFIVWLRHFVPHCQANFIFRVDPDTIRQRKQELSVEEMLRIYQRLEYLASIDKSYHWIDNNGTPEEAVKQIIHLLCSQKTH
jgi:thymidylate kinase